MRAIVLVAAGLAAGTSSPAQDVKKEEELQGRWATTGFFGADGKVLPVAEDDTRYFTFEFGKDKLVTRLKKGTLEGTYKAAPSRKPKEIDVVRKVGGEERTFKGIYAFEMGRLRVCLAGAENDRPTDFRSGKGIEFAVELKRVKE